MGKVTVDPDKDTDMAALHLAYDGTIWMVAGDLRDPAWPERTNLDVQAAVHADLARRSSRLTVDGCSSPARLLLAVPTQQQARALLLTVRRVEVFRAEQPAMKVAA